MVSRNSWWELIGERADQAQRLSFRCLFLTLDGWKTNRGASGAEGIKRNGLSERKWSPSAPFRSGKPGSLEPGRTVTDALVDLRL